FPAREPRLVLPAAERVLLVLPALEDALRARLGRLDGFKALDDGAAGEELADAQDDRRALGGRERRPLPRAPPPPRPAARRLFLRVVGGILRRLMHGLDQTQRPGSGRERTRVALACPAPWYTAGTPWSGTTDHISRVSRRRLAARRLQSMRAAHKNGGSE